VATYHKHMTQRVPGDTYWRVNCMAYAAAMAVNDAVLGGLAGVSGELVRTYSNEPVPDPRSPGLNIGQVIRVARNHYKVNLADRTGQSWDYLMDRLREGRRIILAIEYKPLGSARCQDGGDFAHAMCLVRDSGTNTVYASDPLCGTAKNYSENALRAAATALGNENGGKLFWAMTRPIPLLR
jgi:hypothetical protein